LISSLGSGTITTVNLAMQIISIVDIFFVSQILSTSGIKFNELVAARDYVTLNSIFIKVSKVIFMVIFPLVAIIFFYHSQIVSILFVRGKFDRESAATLGVCITFLIFLCPLSAINSLGTRLISSFQQIDKTILISITTHIVFLILTYVLTNNMGLLGYLISSIIGYFLLTSAFYLLFTIYFKFISFNDLLKDCVIQFVLNFLIALFFRAAVMDIISNDLTMLFCATFIQIAAVTMFNYKFILKVYK
jgi:putative peptidoglycan lipid II flippase